MTTRMPPVQARTGSRNHTGTPEPRGPARHRETLELASALRLHLTYPSRGAVVVTAVGDIDTATTPRVAALLWPRLLTKLSSVVLDLSGVTFLGVEGVALISAARAYAPHRDVEFTVVGGPAAVERALRAGELAGVPTPRS
ncbi:STAS domain-containing protein [Saccharopolyspora sp. NPDC000359]|uniref:STAS domain-containing protein n=1 Tax=Saccharopolyspora sp. NPDC000359 TaxID=3154251 RepID=UPI003330C4F7